MRAERALADLRRELRAAGVETEEHDVFATSSGDPMLSLAPGLIVWAGPEWFRWVGERDRWRYHTTGDPAGAARLIRRFHDRLRRDRPEEAHVRHEHP
ncbi:hypothetical protein [Streptosporangium sp. NPDC000239]|uniref:Uncharacterized protein n=1 Tax=Streptosporangium jomthongense TaxID=1193683 RepID=A0ABV8F023_9ACTN